MVGVMRDNLQPAFAKPQYNIGLLCQFIGVGNDHNAFARLMGAVFENGGYFRGGILVQIPSRLIGQNNLRFTGQGAGDGYSLLLSSGQFQYVFMAVFWPGHADRPALRLCREHPGHEHEAQ